MARNPVALAKLSGYAAGLLTHPLANGPEQHRQEDDPESLDARRRAEWRQELGIDPPPWRDDADAPAVDELKLRALQHGQLPAADTNDLLMLVVRFRSWASAYGRITAEVQLETRRPEQDA